MLDFVVVRVPWRTICLDDFEARNRISRIIKQFQILKVYYTLSEAIIIENFILTPLWSKSEFFSMH